MTPRQVAKTLGIKLDFDELEKKGEIFTLHQLKRRVRYYCFAMQRKVNEPKKKKVRVAKKFVDYYENHPKFEGWAKFAETWDIDPKNPLEIVYRQFSIYEEWNATMRRVVPELPVNRIKRQESGYVPEEK